MKKIVLILTIIVAGVGIASTSLAATYSVNPGSAGSLCSGNYPNRSCRASTQTSINIPSAGRYTVSVRVERGNNIGLYECQGKESFYMIINGQRTPVVRDPDSCEWSGTVKTQRVSGEYSLRQGSNTIRLFHAHYGESRIGIESLIVRSISFQSVQLPPVNGVCGSSNGRTLDTNPTSGLCSVGSASGVSGSGPWSWTCRGRNGGSTASCNANITVAPVCGSTDGQTIDIQPTSGLCSVGSASNINGSGPWNWTCTNGVRTVDCDANITPAPECGSSNGQLFSGAPTSGFCAVGTASSINGSGPWNWTCTNGARTTDCDATYAQTAIQIIKTNGTNGGDSQTIDSGEDASFTITVRNTGEEILENVVVRDDDASDCERTADQTVTLHDGSLFDVDESFTYTCVDTNVTSSYTNTADTVADATTSSVTATDEDTSNVVVSEPEVPQEPQQITPEPPVTPEPETTPAIIQEEPEEEEEDDGAIGNFVWHDRNKDGVQDPGEEGIAGVRLKLYNGNDIEKDKTNSRGRYKFKDLDPGQYKVVVAQETLPEGCYQTYDKDGVLDNQIKTRIEGDEYYRKADFGYYCPSTKPVAQVSPQTGSGAVAGSISFLAAALSAGFIYKRNARKNC